MPDPHFEKAVEAVCKIRHGAEPHMVIRQEKVEAIRRELQAAQSHLIAGERESFKSLLKKWETRRDELRRAVEEGDDDYSLSLASQGGAANGLETAINDLRSLLSNEGGADRG